MSTYTIWKTLKEAGFDWQRDRSWCETGVVERKRKGKVVKVIDPDATGQKKLIERAYTEGESSGIAVWTEDEAGPYQTVPYPGASWQPTGEPKRRPHEYVRQGTAKLLTLFPPGHRRGAGARGEASRPTRCSTPGSRKSLRRCSKPCPLRRRRHPMLSTIGPSGRAGRRGFR